MIGLSSEQQDAVRILRIDRPDVYNALNADLIKAIADAVDLAAEDPAVRVVVLTGMGEKAFSAGADLSEISTLGDAEAFRYMAAGQRQFQRIERARIPVIAAVNGLALGGGFELVLVSTFAVMSERASLGLPEAALGLIPGYGGTQRLQHRIGANVAAYMMTTGRRIDAERAYVLGLAVVPPVPADTLVATAIGIANEIAAKGPRAIEAILDLLRTGQEVALDAALDLETKAAAAAIAGRESDEGIAAFNARRTPDFSNLEGKP